MIYTNTTPQTVVGPSTLAAHPSNAGGTTTPAVFTYDPETNRYYQGGDRNKAEKVKSVTTCAGRITGKYSLSDLHTDIIIIDSPLRLITPAAGDYKVIDSLLTAFTCTDNQEESETQKQLLISWLQHAVKALYTGNQTAAPVLIFQPQEAAPASPFIVENIIKPLLGDTTAPLTPYFTPSGAEGYTKLTAQGEAACLLYDPAADFENLRPAWGSHIESLFRDINTAQTRQEYIFKCVPYSDHLLKLKPIYRAALESPHGVPFLNLNQEKHLALVCLLYVNSPTLARSEKSLNALAAECREQLPAFLHYLLNERPESTPAGYASPSALRVAQKAAFIREKTANVYTRAFYKIATILTLEQDSSTGAKTVSRENAFDLFRDITKAAKAYNMPLPAQEWTPDELQSILDHIAPKFPAYLSQVEGGGWMIHLSAIERDILLS